jgi:hypothetical protein
MNVMTCGGALAGAFAVLLGIGYLLDTSLSEDRTEITGSIEAVQPPVKLKATEDIFLTGSAELMRLSEAMIPGEMQRTRSEPAVKVSTAKRKHNPKPIDGPSLLAVIPPPI